MIDDNEDDITCFSYTATHNLQQILRLFKISRFKNAIIAKICEVAALRVYISYTKIKEAQKILYQSSWNSHEALG